MPGHRERHRDPAEGRSTGRRRAWRPRRRTPCSRERSAPSMADHHERHRDEGVGQHHAPRREGKLKPVARAAARRCTPVRPNAVRSAMPATTGGSTSGTVTSARSRPRPRKSTRASTQASGSPRTRQISIAAVEVTRREPAAPRGAARSASWSPRPAQSARGDHRRPAGRASSAVASAAGHQQDRRRAAERVAVTARRSRRPRASAWPSSDITRSTHSWARSASSDCSSVATKYDVSWSRRAGDLDRR